MGSKHWDPEERGRHQLSLLLASAGIHIHARKRQVLKKQRTPTRREVGQKNGNRAQGPDRRSLLHAGSDTREPQAGGVPQSGFGSIGEVTRPPELAQRRLGPREQPLRAADQTRGAGRGRRPPRPSPRGCRDVYTPDSGGRGRRSGSRGRMGRR